MAKIKIFLIILVRKMDAGSKSTLIEHDYKSY